MLYPVSVITEVISPPSHDHLATISRSSHHHLVIFTLYISIIIILYFNTVPYIFKEIINNCGSMVHMYIYCTFILRTLSFLNDVFQNCIICTNTVLCTSLKCKIIKSSCFNSSANTASYIIPFILDSSTCSCFFTFSFYFDVSFYHLPFFFT